MGKQLETPKEQDNATLVPLTAEHNDAVGERLIAVYDGVPAETATVSERHGIGKDRKAMAHQSGKAKIKVHPLADIFPMLEGDELQALADDIKANGLLHPIVLTAKGELADGRNRYAACELAGVEPVTITLPEGTDIRKFIWSENVRRRHLTQGQQGMALAKSLVLETQFKTGKSFDWNGYGRRNQHSDKVLNQNGSTQSEPAQKQKTQRELAQEAGVPQGRLTEAMTVMHYAPEIADAVIHGAELGPAYKAAMKRKADADEQAEDAKKQVRLMAVLRAEAPDLYDLVNAGKLDIEAAQAALEKQRERNKKRREQTTSNLALGIQTLDSLRVPFTKHLETLHDDVDVRMLQEDWGITRQRLLNAYDMLGAWLGEQDGDDELRRQLAERDAQLWAGIEQ